MKKNWWKIWVKIDSVVQQPLCMCNSFHWKSNKWEMRMKLDDDDDDDLYFLCVWIIYFIIICIAYCLAWIRDKSPFLYTAIKRLEKVSCSLINFFVDTSILFSSLNILKAIVFAFSCMELLLKLACFILAPCVYFKRRIVR